MSLENNIKKRKRHKSKNQINKEKYLDKQKALSYRERESIHFKKPNSIKKSKNDSNNEINDNSMNLEENNDK